MLQLLARRGGVPPAAGNLQARRGPLTRARQNSCVQHLTAGNPHSCSPRPSLKSCSTVRPSARASRHRGGGGRCSADTFKRWPSPVPRPANRLWMAQLWAHREPSVPTTCGAAPASSLCMPLQNRGNALFSFWPGAAVPRLSAFRSAVLLLCAGQVNKK